MAFPLFRLPILAVENVIKSMKLQERYKLSKTSKICRNIVKIVHRRATLQYKITFDEDRFFEAVDFTFNFDTELEFVRSSVFDYDHLEKYRKAIEEVAYLFNKPKVALRYEHITPEFIKRITLFMEELQLTTIQLSIEYHARCDELVKKVLDEYKNISFLEVNCETSRGFMYETDEPFQVDDLSIHNAHWLRPHHLNLFHECRRVRLTGAYLVPADFLGFLSQWCLKSTIDFARISFNGESIVDLKDEILTAVPVECVTDDEQTHYFDPGQAFVIQQDDGKKGCVYRKKEYIFLITGIVSMY